MPCDDLPRHVPPSIPLAQAAVIPHPGCSTAAEARGPCARNHRGHLGDFEVCNRCLIHTQLMLGFPPAGILPAGPAHRAAPYNLDRLGAGFTLPAPLIPPPAPRLPDRSTTAWQLALGPRADPVTRSGVVPWTNGIANAAGNLLPGQPRQPFPGFLTRVCSDCEQLIQLEIMFRENGGGLRPVYNPFAAIAPDIMPEQIQLATWEQYPSVSCTCKYRLGIVPNSERLCKTHQEEVWKELVKKRNINDEWLRNIEKKNGTIQWASQATKRRRVKNNGFWRACRCGKEIDHTIADEPDSYICMACEGYVTRYGLESIHGNGLLVVGAPAAAPPVLPLTFNQWWKRTQPQRLKLNRHPELSFQQVQEVTALP